MNFEKLKSMKMMFGNTSLINLSFDNLIVPNVESLDNMFTGELNNISFKNIDFFNLLTMNNIVPRNIRYFYFININASKLTTLEKLFNYINCLQYVIFENNNGLISFKNINFSNLYKIENFIEGYY